MAALAHVFLHVGLCAAVARKAPDTGIAMRVQMTYPTGGPELDRVYRFERGDDMQTVVEFDIPRGTYRLRLDVPKYGCAASEYVDVLADRNRTIAATLSDGPPPQQTPAVLIDGTAPISFLYVKPSFVLFDKDLRCDQPVPPPLPAHTNIEYDQGSYYVWLFSDPSLTAHEPVVVALRLKTPTGTAHYIRVPIALPARSGGWPDRVHMDVTGDMLDGIATDKTETLLCPKLWETSVH